MLIPYRYTILHKISISHDAVLFNDIIRRN